MDELLTPVSTTYLRARKDDQPLLSEVSSTRRVTEIPRVSRINSPDEALEILRNQPDYDSLVQVLRYLTKDAGQPDAFTVHIPDPKSAAIIHVLVTDIAANYWTLLKEGRANGGAEDDRDDVLLFVACLQSVTGLNGVLTHLKALIQEHKLGSREAKRPDLVLHVNIFLDLLATVLEGDSAIQALWTASTQRLATPTLKRVQSQALLSLITGGRILSLAAEAMEVAGSEDVDAKTTWPADGARFTQWVGHNVISWAKLIKTEDELHFCSDIFQRSMSLGYPESLVKTVIDGLLLREGNDPNDFARVCLSQPSSAKRTMNLLLQHLAQHLNGLDLDAPSSKALVSAAAGVIDAVIKGNDGLYNHLVAWCTSSSGAGLGDAVGIRRAILAVVAQNKVGITTVFEKSLAQFGDQLYIKHAAILQQNVHAETLLLSAGYISRLSPIKLRLIVRSGSYLTAISNRIAATQARARFLGLVVGESLSTLMDDKSQKLDFHMEETDSEEAQWLKSLTNISDEVGSIEPLLKAEASGPPAKKESRPTPRRTQKLKAKPKPKPGPGISTIKPIAIVEEVDSSDDDEDLVPYAKGSDPEDSDEDATLVQRNKPKAPVYIRDLILYLRDTESYDKQKLALQSAPLLIRRKANFGMEVSSHADELAGLLVGLQDKFDIEDFNDLKLQGMMALIVAQPKAMAPWFSRTFFEGDYSLSQRTQVLVAIGLSARELAGFDASEYQAAASFPSKRLPEKMEQLYLDSPKQGDATSSSQLKALPSTAIDTIAQSLTSSFLEPMAAKAADASTGPDMLKLSTFTARYKSKTKAKPRTRSIPNTTAALIADSFFYPLTAHFQVALRSSKPVILNPALLALYLQTLGIIIHAAGPSTLSLPQLTSELWDLLLAVRIHTQDDLGALRGWFVAMASLLEVNDGDMRRLCETQGREVVETREWAATVFNRIRGEDGGEENEVKMLSAGVLIKLGEAIEKYQALLMGNMIGF
ncbi:telomere length regulation domain-containing protein [Trichoderma novae-zelandiae]